MQVIKGKIVEIDHSEHESHYNQEYKFKAEDDIKEGDRVLVVTTRGYRVLDVTQDSVDVSIEKVSKWVVCKVDTKSFFERKVIEKKRQSLIDKMSSRQKKLEKELVFHMLAEKDDEMKSLLEELKQLDK